MLLLYILISASLHLSISSLTTNCIADKQKSQYDYIVIGSGPGGATVATRLALNNFKVLLIEAGPDHDDKTTRTPLLWPAIELNKKVTANFDTYIYSKEDHMTIKYPRGITLGGSAQINAMIAMNANPSEWDDIARITNDSNWNYETIKNKYQPLIENCQYCANNDNRANKNGWLNVSVSNNELISSSLFHKNQVLTDLRDALASQLKFNPDVGQNNTYDSFFYQPKTVNQETGYRSGPYRRIKDVQAARPSNLHIWTNSFVTKLIIDSATKDACGVEYVKGESLYKATLAASDSSNSNNYRKFSIYAKREIIVSGGQWMSPQLLQLSGIGDEQLLSKFGIETIQHLPGVGRNQQDRNEVPYIVKLKWNANLPGLIRPLCIFGDLINRNCLTNSDDDDKKDGLFTSNTILFSVLRSAQPKQENFPDSVLSFSTLRFTGFRENWVLNALPNVLGSYLSVNINFARVENNLGTVQIQSRNAFDTPLIESNHLRGENRQKETNQIMEHIRFIRKLLFESPFSKHIASEEFPGGDVQTDAQLTEYINKYVWGHHACCTNKMGNTETDPMAVVNSKGQVKGIKNLRVADISMFPKIPGYFPVVPITVACEKIADDIINDTKF